jgi:hypothetical protein
MCGKQVSSSLVFNPRRAFARLGFAAGADASGWRSARLVTMRVQQAATINPARGDGCRSFPTTCYHAVASAMQPFHIRVHFATHLL